MLRAVLTARDLVGSFEKPRYIAYDDKLCAHSRSGIVGCTRCLDLCPTSAPSRPRATTWPSTPMICAGCGQCAAVCPTGAASYALPPEDALMRKLRAMLTAYREAGGERPIVLLHDDPHGAPLIDALARFGDGLPAHVLPLAVNEVTQVGLESIAAASPTARRRCACCCARGRGMTSPGCRETMALADPILTGLGFGPGRSPPSRPTIRISCGRRCAQFLRCLRAASGELPPVGGKRSVLRFALSELHRAAPEPVDVIALPEGAPFGAGRNRRRRLHAVPVLRVGLSDRRVARRPRTPDAALCRRCLRAVRIVRGNLPRERHHAKTAARFRRRQSARPHPQGGRAVLLHPLRQAVRRQEHDRARGSKARGQALDVQRIAANASTSSRCATTAALPLSPSKTSIPTARTARPSAPPMTICASARHNGVGTSGLELMPQTSRSLRPCVIRARPGISPCAKPARACASRFRCAFTSSGGVSASH